MPHGIEDTLKAIGIDLSIVVAVLVSWLPSIQGILGVLVTFVVLLIQIKRYQNLKHENKEEK